ncbi:IS3 family transposase [Acinetobacter sp. YH01020]
MMQRTIHDYIHYYNHERIQLNLTKCAEFSIYNL